MYLVTVLSNYIDIKDEYKFNGLAEANEYLYKEGFYYDSDDDKIHYWTFDEYINATVVKTE